MASENLEVLFEVPNVMRIGVDPQGNRQDEGSGILQLLYSRPRNMYFVGHQGFLYALNKDIPVMANTRPKETSLGKRYIISMGEGKGEKAFVLDANVSHEDVGKIDGFFDQNAKLLFGTDGVEPEWTGHKVYATTPMADTIRRSNSFREEMARNSPSKQAQVPPAKGTFSEQWGSTMTNTGHDLMHKIAAYGASWGQSIMGCSEKVKAYVGKNDQPIKVPSWIANKINFGAKTTTKVTSFAQNAIVTAIDMGLKTGFAAKNEFMKSQAGSKVANNKYFVHAGNLTTGAFNFVTGIYYGLENGFAAVGEATKDSTSEVIGYKYGNEARDLFMNTANAAWQTYQLRSNVSKAALKRLGHYMRADLNENFQTNLNNSVQTNIPYQTAAQEYRNYKNYSGQPQPYGQPVPQTYGQPASQPYAPPGFGPGYNQNPAGNNNMNFDSYVNNQQNAQPVNPPKQSKGGLWGIFGGKQKEKEPTPAPYQQQQQPQFAKPQFAQQYQGYADYPNQQHGPHPTNQPPLAKPNPTSPTNGRFGSPSFNPSQDSPLNAKSKQNRWDLFR